MESPLGSGLPMMRIVGFAGWPSMAAAQIVRCLEMTALWYGVSVHTAFTCIAFLSGSTPSKFSSSTAQCVGRSGSSKSDWSNIFSLYLFLDFMDCPFVWDCISA